MKKIISLILAVTMLFSVVMLTSCGSKEPTKFESGEAHLEYVANKEVKKLNAEALKDYKTIEEFDRKVEADVKISVGSSLISLLSRIPNFDMGGLDLSFVKSLGLKSQLNVKEKQLGEKYALSFNDVELVSADLFADLVKNEIAARIPMLASDWIELPTDKISDILGGNSRIQLPTGFENVNVTLPDKETLEKLIDRYVGAVLGEIKNVVEGEEERQMSDETVKFVTVSFELDKAAVTAIAKKVLTTLKTDEDVKKIVEGAAKGETLTEDPYKQFTEELDKALKKLDGEKEDKDEKPFTAAVKIYTDKENAIKGAALAVKNDGRTTEFSILCTEKNDRFLMNADFTERESENSSQTVSVVADGKKSNGKLTSDFVVSYNGEKVLTLKVENFDTEAIKNGVFNGKISLGVGDVLNLAKKAGMSGDEMALASLLLGGMTLTAEGTGTKENRTLRCALSTSDGELITVVANIKQGPADPIEAVTEKKSLEDVTKNLDPQALLNTLSEKLKEAGVPENILSSIPMLLSGFGGASAGGDVDYEF
ncbi:MAG: hypothetical protein IJU52_04340 [Clostridia bacterium]|nr:hypothetical protein [Clostridia bacterium]